MLSFISSIFSATSCPSELPDMRMRVSRRRRRSWRELVYQRRAELHHFLTLVKRHVAVESQSAHVGAIADANDRWASPT